MSFTYKQLQAFVTVATVQSYAIAAQRLHITQPALSMSVKTLEDLVGGKLLVRSTRQVGLTPEGKHFLARAKRLLNEWDGAFQDIHSLFALQQGSLSLAAMPSFASSMLPGLIAQFANHYPMVKVIVQDAVMEEVVNGVLRGQSELGFVFRPDLTEGLDFLPLLQSDFIVVCPAQHALAQHKELQWQLLQGFKMVAMNRGAAIRKWVDEAMVEQGVSVKVVAEAAQLDTLGQLVSVDLGIAIVPSLCRAQMLSKGLCCVRLLDEQLRKEIGVIRQSRSNLSQAAQAFWQHVAENKPSPQLLT
ncbi:MAG: LysR family transcriptional regulator [Aestuariibacter sp.]